MDGYGLRYVQFIVNDADKLHEQLIEAGVTIALEPVPLGETTVLMFSQDPDGVINENVGAGRS